MDRTPLAKIAVVVLALLLQACAGTSGPPDLALVHDNSCGRSFSAVNDAGTAQLSLSPSPDDDQEDIEPGLIELANGTWAGRLEVGSGLRVWPCHDIATDFEEVEVESVWVATSGTIEISQILPETSSLGGGGVREPFTIVATDVVLTNGTETIDIPEVTLATEAWGFYGG